MCWQSPRYVEPGSGRLADGRAQYSKDSGLLSLARGRHGLIVHLLAGRLLIRGGLMLCGRLAARLEQQAPELAPRRDLHRDGRAGERGASHFGPVDPAFSGSSATAERDAGRRRPADPRSFCLERDPTRQDLCPEPEAGLFGTRRYAGVCPAGASGQLPGTRRAPAARAYGAASQTIREPGGVAADEASLDPCLEVEGKTGVTSVDLFDRSANGPSDGIAGTLIIRAEGADRTPRRGPNVFSHKFDLAHFVIHQRYSDLIIPLDGLRALLGEFMEPVPEIDLIACIHQRVIRCGC